LQSEGYKKQGADRSQQFLVKTTLIVMRFSEKLILRIV